jgi:hypothetical protein
MNPLEDSIAFGAPGIEPRWTSSAKEGVGTAYHTSCRVWFTLSHGILNEIYYPHVDQPNTRDFQFLISDGETFCHEEKRDLDALVEAGHSNLFFTHLAVREMPGSVPATCFLSPVERVRIVSGLLAPEEPFESLPQICGLPTQSRCGFELPEIVKRIRHAEPGVIRVTL